MIVSFYGSVQQYTSDEKTFDAGDAESIRALIDRLGGNYGERFMDFLLGDNTCFFLVNGKGILTTGGLDTPLRPGDAVELLPFVDGG